MSQPTALIAEDEPVLAATLAATLQRLWPQLSIVALVANGVAAVEAALTHCPDVLFLDIKMPGKTGLEAAQELAEDWPHDRAFPLVVFVTAYDDYALAAFEQAAVDYVCKPVSDERLAKTVARLKQRLAAPAGTTELERLISRLHTLMPAAPAAERLRLIRAAVGNQVRMIPVDEVVYFEAADKYVRVVTREGESLIRTSLKELSPQLDPSQFWQIHRGTLVNAGCIAAALRDESGRISLRLRDHGDILQVSRVYAHLFRQM
jgi:DNA-binding LytR/AlgR family response regulator